MKTRTDVALASGRSLNFRFVEPTQGKPTVVFLHGLGRDLSYWAEHAASIEQRGFGTLRLDLHGHGDTPWQHGSVIPSSHQIDDIASLIVELGIEKAHVVGHSYGGYIALGLGERGELREKIMRIDAWVPYLQHLGYRSSDEVVERCDDMWNMNPLHVMGMMMPFSPWSIMYRAGRASLRATGRATVAALNTQSIDYIRRRFGKGAAAATMGLPDDAIAHPPRIASSISVRVFLGGPGSMAPKDLNLPFECNRLAYEFKHGKSNVSVHDFGYGGHHLPGEYPKKVVDSIFGSI